MGPITLLLIVNTLALLALISFSYYSFNQTTTKDQRLNKIENKLSLLDESLKKTEKIVATGPSFGTNDSLPVTGSATTEASTAETPPPVDQQEQVVAEPQQQAQAVESNAVDTSVTTPKTYVIQSGDTLSLVAEKYSLTLDELMTKNNLSNSTVLVGQVLTIN